MALIKITVVLIMIDIVKKELSIDNPICNFLKKDKHFDR